MRKMKRIKLKQHVIASLDLWLTSPQSPLAKCQPALAVLVLEPCVQADFERNDFMLVQWDKRRMAPLISDILYVYGTVVMILSTDDDYMLLIL